MKLLFFPDDEFTHTYLGVIVWISSHLYQGIIFGYNLRHNRWVSIIEYDHSPRLRLPNRRAKIEAQDKLTVNSTIKPKLAHLCTCSYISRFPIKSKLMFVCFLGGWRINGQPGLHQSSGTEVVDCFWLGGPRSLLSLGRSYGPSDFIRWWPSARMFSVHPNYCS